MVVCYSGQSNTRAKRPLILPYVRLSRISKCILSILPHKRISDPSHGTRMKGPFAGAKGGVLTKRWNTQIYIYIYIYFLLPNLNVHWKKTLIFILSISP